MKLTTSYTSPCLIYFNVVLRELEEGLSAYCPAVAKTVASKRKFRKYRSLKTDLPTNILEYWTGQIIWNTECTMQLMPQNHIQCSSKEEGFFVYQQLWTRSVWKFLFLWGLRSSNAWEAKNHNYQTTKLISTIKKQAKIEEHSVGLNICIQESNHSK